MKKSVLFAAMAALAFSACIKEEGQEVVMNGHTIKASMEVDAPESKTAFDRQSGSLYWIAGDDIAVYAVSFMISLIGIVVLGKLNKSKSRH